MRSAPPGIDTNDIAATLLALVRVKLLGKRPWQNGEEAWEGCMYGPNENGLMWEEGRCVVCRARRVLAR